METKIRKYDSGFLEVQATAGNEEARLLILPDTGRLLAKETRIVYFNTEKNIEEVMIKREADEKHMKNCPYTLARFFGMLGEEVEEGKTIEYKKINHETEDQNQAAARRDDTQAL